MGLTRVERNRHGSAGCGAFTGKVTLAGLTTMMAPTNPVGVLHTGRKTLRREAATSARSSNRLVNLPTSLEQPCHKAAVLGRLIDTVT